MNLSEFEQLVGALLAQQPVMSLSTCDDGMKPWASDVYFAPLNYRLVFYSSLRSRHIHNVETNPACAATVHPHTTEWTDIHGLQMSGIVQQLKSADQAQAARDSYLSKFPFAGDLLTAITTGATAEKDRLSRAVGHVFVPSYIRYIDNRRGFGSRFSVDLRDGFVVSNVHVE